jgi:Sec-independent protein translocase protein TatA
MVLQVVAVCVVILAAKRLQFHWLGTLLLWMVVVSAIGSAVQYFKKFWSQLDDRVKQRRKLSVLDTQPQNPQDVATL